MNKTKDLGFTNGTAQTITIDQTAIDLITNDIQSMLDQLLSHVQYELDDTAPL